MDKQLQSLKNYLDSAHSVYHAVAGLVDMLEAEGYVRLSEGDSWQLIPGGKYYLTRGGTALIAFRVNTAAPKGFMMCASHSDRPTFKIRENGELSGKYTRLSTEPYGGMIISTWLDRPLSVAGRALVETQSGIESRLIDFDRDLLLIPSVAIHMNRKVNDGFSWNPAVDTLPLLGGPDAAGKFAAALEQAADGKVLGSDLYLYIREKASVWGMDGEFISSAALDDLVCAWCSARGFLEADTSDSIPVLCVFDCEEVGSASVQGAASRLLESTLERICKALCLDTERLLSSSFMVSADNAHGLHPNHPELADANNAPVLNGGVVLKFAATQKYTTDGVSAAIFRKICAKAGVNVQTYCNRADIPGGSTLGCISLSHVSVPTADIGTAQLAMHSSYETAGADDIRSLCDAMKAYFGTTLEATDGSYIIR